MHSQLTKLYKEPLVHFLVLGCGLFWLFNFSQSEIQLPSSITAINVNEEALTTYMQFRAKNTNKDQIKNVLIAMSDIERQKIIDGYIQEEVLYREAKSMKLDSDDFIIRRRLVQKMDFITRGISSDLIEPTTKELTQYFDSNKEDYFVDASVTFTHIFFDYNKHGKQRAQQYALAKLQEIPTRPILFEQSMQHGDRFPFHNHYVDKTASFIESHFNLKFSQQVFSEANTLNKWLGPISSPYGDHLIMVQKNESGHFPTFEEVSAQVAEDFFLDRIDKLQQQAINAVKDGYQITIDYPVVDNS